MGKERSFVINEFISTVYRETGMFVGGIYQRLFIRPFFDFFFSLSRFFFLLIVRK